jgi:Holliday junction resolvase RusA-like endonuclease
MRTIQQDGRVAFLNLKANVPYELQIIVFFDQLEYKASTKGSRYKKIDLSNQVKLIEDTVAEATGIGDEHNFRLILEKNLDPENPGMYVRLRPINEKSVGLTRSQYDAKVAEIEDTLGTLDVLSKGFKAIKDGDENHGQVRSTESYRTGRVVSKIRIPKRSSRNINR